MTRFKTFYDNVVETRYFDNDGEPTDTEQADGVTLVRTESNYFGYAWHAVQPNRGARIGHGERDASHALLRGLTHTVSSAARVANIEIVKGHEVAHYTRYTRDVLLDGKRLAYFRPYTGNEWSLCDLAGEPVLVFEGAAGYGRQAECDKISNMEDTVRRWLEFIPDQEAINKRTERREQAELDKQAAEKAEAIKDVKEQFGPRMFDVLSDIVEQHATGSIKAATLTEALRTVTVVKREIDKC